MIHPGLFTPRWFVHDPHVTPLAFFKITIRIIRVIASCDPPRIVHTKVIPLSPPGLFTLKGSSLGWSHCFNVLYHPSRLVRTRVICSWSSSSLRAESARAVTGRRCPHSGKGEDFLMGQLNFFTETAVTPERKVEKSIPRWEINRHAEG